MLWWLKSGQVKEQLEIGQRLGRDTSTVTRWLQKYRASGLSGLLEIKKAPGANRKINDEALCRYLNASKFVTSENRFLYHRQYSSTNFTVGATRFGEVEQKRCDH
ncbi:MAG: helix-turn-helix domain-containing protein [Komarekiella atlantica HA4396-MV6]|jgi:hypothetical protein|nr:helix-turn-helix domain-containing protein [Komarekiella atlantica HA4396-MV6]